MGRILVIDDEPEIGHIFRRVLEARGHTMLFADDGSRGFATARRHRPDLIVLDLMMPVMNGYSVLEQLCADDKTRDVPVVVLTALTTTAARDRCIELGATNCITKPFDPYRVADTLDTILARRASA